MRTWLFVAVGAALCLAATFVLPTDLKLPVLTLGALLWATGVAMQLRLATLFLDQLRGH